MVALNGYKQFLSKGAVYHILQKFITCDFEIYIHQNEAFVFYTFKKEFEQLVPVLHEAYFYDPSPIIEDNTRRVLFPAFKIEWGVPVRDMDIINDDFIAGILYAEFLQLDHMKAAMVEYWKAAYYG